MSARFKYTAMGCVVRCSNLIERGWAELISPRYASRRQHPIVTSEIVARMEVCHSCSPAFVCVVLLNTVIV